MSSLSWFLAFTNKNRESSSILEYIILSLGGNTCDLQTEGKHLTIKQKYTDQPPCYRNTCQNEEERKLIWMTLSPSETLQVDHQLGRASLKWCLPTGNEKTHKVARVCTLITFSGKLHTQLGVGEQLGEGSPGLKALGWMSSLDRLLNTQGPPPTPGEWVWMFKSCRFLGTNTRLITKFKGRGSSLKSETTTFFK